MATPMTAAHVTPPAIPPSTQPHQGDRADRQPARRPQQQAGCGFRAELFKNRLHRRLLSAQHLQGQRHRLNADAFRERQHHRDEQGQCDCFLQFRLENARQQCRKDSPANVGQQPGEPAAKGGPGRQLLGIGEVYADQLE
jgi:hypothetical protein